MFPIVEFPAADEYKPTDMSPEVNQSLMDYLDKFDVLISVDFEIPDISPVRVIDVGNGYTRYAGKKYPHRLYVYELNN